MCVCIIENLWFTKQGQWRRSESENETFHIQVEAVIFEKFVLVIWNVLRHAENFDFSI